MSGEPRFDKRCEACGSDNVFRDAYASWDKATQRWQLEQVFDEAHCHDCHGSCHIINKEIT